MTDNCMCVLAQVCDREKFSERIYSSFFGESSKNDEPTHLVVFHHEDGRVVFGNAL